MSKATHSRKPQKGNHSKGSSQDREQGSHDYTPESRYVTVEHFGYVTLANGQTMEDPTTVRQQKYTRTMFNKMNEQRVDKSGKMNQSKFQKMGVGVRVLD